MTVTALARRQVDGAAHLAWVLEDDRPVVGWKVAALGPDGRVCLTPDPLPAAARSCVVAADAQWDLVLDALLPFGGICEAGTSAGGTKDLRFALSESVPNPVRGQASLAFTVPRSGAASLRVYDLRGRCVATLLDGHVEAGPTMLVWPGRDDEGRQLADGVYFLRLEQSGRSLTRKILLVR